MDALFQEMLRTLREARSVLEAELDTQARADILNVDALRRLLGSAAELVGQAEALVVMMQGRDADEALITAAEELCEFFEAAADQVASLLGVDRG